MSHPSIIGRRSALIGAAALAGASTALAREGTSGPCAVELFTSQGCSSCPPADAQLGRLVRRPDVVALSFHVDYWDYIGWKDPFASRETTERQRTYARVLKQRYVYTPEMVFDGAAHDSATSSDEVDAMLQRAQRRTAVRATPELVRAHDGPLTIRLAAFELEAAQAEVTLAVYDRHHTTPVRRGENSGATLDNFNVVRRLELVARWDGSAASWTVPADRFAQGQGIAVLVQRADQGPMLGCNKLEPTTTG